MWFFWKITLGENHVVRSWWELLSKIFSVSKNFHNMILLSTKITLWEFFKTKMKHHIMRNHVMGNHISRGTAVLHFIYRYIFCLLLFRVMHTCVVICSEKWEYFLHSTKKTRSTFSSISIFVHHAKKSAPFFQKI